eukprot:gene16753-23028_t
MTIRVRRAEAQDVPDVDNLCAQLHGHDEVGSMLLEETAFVAFVAVGYARTTRMSVSYGLLGRGYDRTQSSRARRRLDEAKRKTEATRAGGDAIQPHQAIQPSRPAAQAAASQPDSGQARAPVPGPPRPQHLH